MVKRVWLALTACLMSACASVPNNYAPVSTQISKPSLNEIHVATLGDQMLLQATATLSQGVYLPQQNNIKGFVLSPGFYPKTGEEKGQAFTSFDTRNNGFDQGVVSLDGGLFGPIILPRAIRFDKKNKKPVSWLPIFMA